MEMEQCSFERLGFRTGKMDQCRAEAGLAVSSRLSCRGGKLKNPSRMEILEPHPTWCLRSPGTYQEFLSGQSWINIDAKNVKHAHVPGRLPQHTGAPLEEVGVVRLVDSVNVPPYVLPRGSSHVGWKRRTDRDRASVICLFSGSKQRSIQGQEQGSVRLDVGIG